MRWERAAAKINLTLRVVGRRSDGYHDLESLVAFAGLGDWLGFEPGDKLTLRVIGPRAMEMGPSDENLVVRAARSLVARVPGLRVGQFRLIKQMPAAAGLGGGSADAAAALRLLAAEAGLQRDDPRVIASAKATGADVLACLFSQARTIRGVGDELGPVTQLPNTFVLLANPQVPAPTSKVFAALNLSLEAHTAPCSQRDRSMDFDPNAVWDLDCLGQNDLEAAAIWVAPPIAVVLRSFSKISGAKAKGMSGSGATCFALFSDLRNAISAHRSISKEYPHWWFNVTKLI